MTNICFDTQNVPLPSCIHKKKTAKVLFLLAEAYGVEEVNLNYIFCSDEDLLDINKRHLGHDYYTDIITFPYQEGLPTIEGEIYISVDRVADNAQKFKVTFEEELHRVMAHGILHLIGFRDKTKVEIKAMRAAEQDAILFFQNHAIL